MKRPTNRLGIALYVSLIASVPFSAWSPLYAQLQNGNIIGTIVDPGGAFVPGVTVTAMNETSNTSRTVTSGSDGTYPFQLLPAGSYTITAEVPGFKKFTNSNVKLDVGQGLPVDIKLELGEVTAEVRVSGEAAVIETESSGISTVRGTNYFTRNPRDQWSTVNFGQPTVSMAGGYFGYNGSKQTDATITQDGVEFATYNNYVLPYSVDEVKVDHTDAPAQYQTPVNINLVMKRGTNDLHGRAEFSLFNNSLNAISNPRAHTRPPGIGSWKSGISASGPVYIPKLYDGRNRTFWMFTYTPQKNFKSINPVTQTQAPLPWRTGDFSQFYTGQLRNPFTNQPFPGNVIPATMINSTAKNLNSYLGTPTLGPTQVEGTIEYNNNIWTTKAYRVDHKIKDNLEFSTSFTQFSQSFVAEFSDRSIKAGRRGRWKMDLLRFCPGLTHTMSPHLVNEIRDDMKIRGRHRR